MVLVARWGALARLQERRLLLRTRDDPVGLLAASGQHDHGQVAARPESRGTRIVTAVPRVSASQRS